MPRFLSTYRDYILIALFVLISSLVVWLPFFPQLSVLGMHLRGTDTGTIYRNYDGLLYVVAAKSWYDPAVIDSLSVEQGLPSQYYAAHLPLYPALIRALSFLGYIKAMMVVTLASSVMLGWLFYSFVRNNQLTKRPLLLTITMLMLPRFLVVRSIGSPESLFMFLSLAAVWFYEKRAYLGAGVAGGLAVMTKLPGILLFPALIITEGIRMYQAGRFRMPSVWLLLIPAGLLSACLVYMQQYHDFFAYWHTGYVVPMPYPYSAFNSTARWVGTHWLEEIVLYFYVYATTVIYAYRHHLRSLFTFSLVFFIGLLFVQHRDIARYALPLWPITCIIFERFFTSKKAIIVLIAVTPAIYLYAWGFLQGNAMPVSNWAPYL